MATKQGIKTSPKKQSKPGRGVRIQGEAYKDKGSLLQNISQILLGEGILTKGSDKNAVAAALGLSDRRPYDVGTN